MLGSPDSRFDSWSVRIREFISGWLFQKKVLRDKVGDNACSDVLGIPHAIDGHVRSSDCKCIFEKVLPEILVGPWNGMVELGYSWL